MGQTEVSAVDTADWPTREIILLEASKLFATRGFLGTSTRDIATAVGIRQPSVYSHFPSKQSIGEELLRRDLHAGITALQRVAALDRRPPVQLYAYLLWEFAYVRRTPFDLRALYLGELAVLPEFEEGRALDETYRGLLGEIVGRGVAGGDFLDLDQRFVLRAIDAIIVDTIRGAAEHVAPEPDEPDLAATFVVRALLARPGRLPAVQAAARVLSL